MLTSLRHKIDDGIALKESFLRDYPVNPIASSLIYGYILQSLKRIGGILSRILDFHPILPSEFYIDYENLLNDIDEFIEFHSYIHASMEKLDVDQITHAKIEELKKQWEERKSGLNIKTSVP